MKPLTQLQEKYANLIQDDFWPYWRQHDDSEYGGVLNCLSNDGGTRISNDKFSWSQGRYLWLLAELLELIDKGKLPKLDRQDMQDCLDRCLDFVLNTCISEENQVYYLLSREGNPQSEPRTGKLFASIFSDCFVIIGLANSMRVSGRTDFSYTLAKLFHSVVYRIQQNNFLTEPYPIPEGYRSHSIPMILLNTSIEYYKALAKAQPSNIEEQSFSLQVARNCANLIEQVFYNPEIGLMREYVSTDENYETKMQDRHVNAGHTIEDCWFLIEFHQLNGTLEEALPQIERLAQNSWEIGWDPTYGGLLRFVDKDGSPPHGDKGDDAFESLIADTWDMKLWWPHSETLYTFLLLSTLSSSERNREIYDISEEYIFRTFPDPVHGEWIQIRDRTGQAEEKVVALPVKDPFHILRNFCRIVEL